MCDEHVVKYAKCGCNWGTYTFPCPLEFSFNKECKNYKKVDETMSGYCKDHAIEFDGGWEQAGEEVSKD